MKKIYLLAALAAIITATLLYFYLNSVRDMAKTDYDTVVIAAVDIPAYTNITSDMLTTAQVSTEDVHPQAIHSPEEALGLVSDGKIFAGEVILAGQLKSIGANSDSLSYMIEDGMRAVTVQVDSMSGVAGFIRQNDHVDVLVTIDVPDAAASTTGSNTKIITNVIAKNIKVLATGSSIGDTSSDGGDTTATYTTITLLVDPTIAERIVFAQAEGRISFILRSVTDDSTENDVPVDRSDVEVW